MTELMRRTLLQVADLGDGWHGGSPRNSGPWLDWRSLRALERRGCVELDFYLEQVQITDKGRAAAKDLREVA